MYFLVLALFIVLAHTKHCLLGFESGKAGGTKFGKCLPINLVGDNELRGLSKLLWDVAYHSIILLIISNPNSDNCGFLSFFNL